MCWTLIDLANFADEIVSSPAMRLSTDEWPNLSELATSDESSPDDEEEDEDNDDFDEDLDDEESE